MQGSGTHVYVSETSHRYELTSFANSTAHQHTSIAVRIKLGTCTDQPGGPLGSNKMHNQRVSSPPPLYNRRRLGSGHEYIAKNLVKCDPRAKCSPLQ